MDAIRSITPLVLDKYLSFDGRIGRLTWFGRQLARVFLILGMAIVIAPHSRMFSGLLFCFLVYFLLANAAKRLHDLNTPGWFSLIVFIPIVCIALLILSGTDGPNKYGDEP